MNFDDQHLYLIRLFSPAGRGNLELPIVKSYHEAHSAGQFATTIAQDSLHSILPQHERLDYKNDA